MNFNTVLVFDPTGKIFLGESIFLRLCKRKMISPEQGYIKVNDEIKFIRSPLLKPNQVVSGDPEVVKAMKRYEEIKKLC